MCKSLYPDDLLSTGEVVLLQVLCQVKKCVSLQILAVTEDDEKTLLLDMPKHTHPKGFSFKVKHDLAFQIMM